MDLLNKMMDWENGDLSYPETVELFAALIKSGECWKLQGCYGRAANELIEAGYIDTKGNVLVDISEEELRELE